MKQFDCYAARAVHRLLNIFCLQWTSLTAGLGGKSDHTFQDGYLTTEITRWASQNKNLDWF